MHSSAQKRFLAFNLISIVALFALILAGGVVRGTGSGMGCPDWPKCFDQYIPPTEVTQLPNDYQAKYVARRVVKNERFAKTLAWLGYPEMAYRISNDPSILQPEEFNAAKTWTEYINRLVGAFYGVLLLVCLFFSFTYLKSYPRIFLLTFFNVLLVVFQAWLGSIVVSTNLLSWVVTVHMLLALVILAISIYTYFCARFLVGSSLQSPKGEKGIDKLKLIAIVTLLITTVQIALGTEVREQIDAIAAAMNNLNRADWVAMIGVKFNLHRDLALLALLATGFMFSMIRRRYMVSEMPFKWATAVVIIIGIQVFTGLVLSYFALPWLTQILHVLLACLLFGGQFYLMLLVGRKKVDRQIWE